MNRIFIVVCRSGRFFVECLDTTQDGCDRVSVVGNPKGYSTYANAERVCWAWTKGPGPGPGKRPPVGPLQAGDRIPVGFDPFAG